MSILAVSILATGLAAWGGFRRYRIGLQELRDSQEGPVSSAHLSLSFNRSFRTHYTDPAKLEADVLAAVRQALREALGPGGGQESCLVRIER